MGSGRVCRACPGLDPGIANANAGGGPTDAPEECGAFIHCGSSARDRMDSGSPDHLRLRQSTAAAKCFVSRKGPGVRPDDK